MVVNCAGKFKAFNHNAVISTILFDFFAAYGRLITVGSNKFGQLGVGDFKPRAGPCVIGGEMVGKRIVHAACGDDFTVVATAGINRTSFT